MRDCNEAIRARLFPSSSVRANYLPCLKSILILSELTLNPMTKLCKASVVFD